MRVKDIMEIGFDALHSDDRLDAILTLFSERGITSAPVLDKDGFVGIVSYSDLARFFSPKDFMSVLDSSSHNANATASVIAKKPPFVLTPDQPASLVAGKLTSTLDCVPVMEGKRLVGIVRPQNVIAFFLSERAKVEAATVKAKPSHAKVEEDENSTTIDMMLEIVKRDGQTTPKKVASELGITEKTAEDLAKLLGKHRLLEINYSFLTGMVMRRIEHGRK